MKLGFYWSYATRSLRRGGQRTLLAVFCVAVGVMAIVALQLVGNMVNSGLTGNIRANNGGDLAITASVSPLAQSDLSYFDQLVQQGTLTTYTAEASTQVQVRDGSANTTATLNAIDANTFPLAGTPTFVSPSGGSLGSSIVGNSIVLTSDVATTLHAQVGDTIHFASLNGRAGDATLGGIINNGGVFGRTNMMMALPTYLALPNPSNIPVTYGNVYADVPGHSDANATSAETQIQQHFSLATVQTTQQALASNQSSVANIRYFLQIVGLLALLIGGIGIVNTMQVALRRRNTEIAMLKTTGYLRSDLYGLFGLEAGLLGLVGGMVGAGAGIGVAMVVRSLVQNAFSITLPNQLDPLTIASGVAVGFVTALIFGLMPIVQASQVRPQAVLRELPEGRGAQSVFTSLGLALILTVLFTALALSILQNTILTLTAVLGTGAFLLLLGLVFSGVVWVISKLPVLESYRWWYVALLLGATAASVALLRSVLAFGIIALAISLVGFLVVLMPRSVKTNVKMALRNIGRQRARTVTTMVALFIGIFAIGLVLTLGQNIQGQLSAAANSGTGANTVVLTSSSDKTAMVNQLQHTSGVTRQDIYTYVRDTPLALNGTPFSQILTQAQQQGYRTNAVVGEIDGVQGYDFASGQQINTTDITIKQGSSLSANDASTTNVLLSTRTESAPLNLHVGDQLVLRNQAGKQTIMVTVVGFYTNAPTVPLFGGILADNHVANALSSNQPQYIFGLHIDAQHITAAVAQLRTAVPNAQVITLADLVAQIDALLNNLVLVLEAVASLALLAGVIIIANTVTLAMLERRRELGILKSFGHTSGTILGEVLIENGIVGGTGALLAMLLATLAASLLGKLTFGLTFSVSPTVVLSVVAGAAVVCMLVSALVAWGATRVRPLEVLRYE